jgi:two-component system, NtrC family, response regulator HydG
MVCVQEATGTVGSMDNSHREKICNEAELLQTILDTMADGVYFIDDHHVIRRWNRAMEKLTGYAAAEAEGRPCSMLREDGQECEGTGLGMVDQALSEAGRISGEEVMIRRKDGRRAPMLVSARRINDDSGAEKGAVITFTDLSEIRRLQDENRLLREEARERASFHNLVGHSPKMREVYHLIELAADTAETILIQGETGTGKELVARAIHHHSARSNGPMVTVNCSALSESLLESELFGHVKGAFTGATRDHKGRFESAEGGTIFLDEAGELPPLVQVKLLRVLQEHTIERVGDGKTRSVDVRVIAATHRNLREMTRRGEFREDLFYRLHVFPIHVPPIRERREDIEVLLRHFIARQRKRTGRAITGFTPEALRLLLAHDWPGNVREIENAVAHAFITCSGGLAGPADLPFELRDKRTQEVLADSAASQQPVAPLDYAPPPLTRDRLEALLRETGWNKAEVARRLGVDRTTVWRRMKIWGIPLQPQR